MKTKLMWLASIILLTTMLLTSGPILAQESEPTAPAGEEIPTETPAEIPTEVPTETPVEIPTEIPVDVPTETPVEVPTETPVEVPTETPAEIPTETPADIPAETPTETPAETPTVTPTGTPVVLSPLEIPENGKVIKDSYIVVFKEDKVAYENKNAIVAFVAGKGGSVKNFYKTTLNGYSAILPPEALEAVRSDPAVDYVEADALFSIDDEPVEPDDFAVQSIQPGATWGLDRIDQHNLPLNSQYTYFTTANNVHVYVIDTGILSSHNEFGGRASADYDAVGDGQNGNDCNGHGTHVAGTIGGSTYGVAKGVRIHAVRVLNCAGSGSTSGVIAGMEWVANNRVLPAVANMSLSGPSSAAIDTAANKMISKSVALVVAASNDDQNACYWSPARVPNAITVGATTSSDARAYFSNWGSCLDLFAPGYNITSAWIGSNSATNTISGTSMASPHVAGVAALFLQTNPGASPATIASLIKNGATTGKVTDLKGSPNRLLYSQSWPLPGKPVLNTPASGALTNDTTPELSWKQANYALSYHIQISRSSSFTLIEQQSEGIEALSFITDFLAEGKWYWRVRALNMIGDYGLWSTYRYFTIDTLPPAAPILIKPLNGTVYVGTPTFSWKASTGAKYYQFEYGVNNGNPESFVHRSAETTKLSYKPPVMAPKIQYYWFVRARDVGGNWSAWSAPFAIYIEPTVPVKPTLINPANNAFTNDTTPELTWKAVDYGANYHVQISSSPKFLIILQEQEGLPLSYITTALADGKYYWRVRARNVNSVYGPWSAPRYFTVDTVAPPVPILVTPADGYESIGIPTFSWKASQGAKYYQFEYGADSNPNDYLYRSNESTSTSHKPLGMDGMVQYYWFVRARDVAGNWSNWSAPFKIMIIPKVPAKVVLTSPLSGYITDNQSLTVGWKTVEYGNTYQIQLDDSSIFSSPNYTYTSDEEASSDYIGPLATGKWYWRVRARNVNDVYGTWSSSRYFTVLPKFNTQFNSAGNFEGWQQHPGATWGVSSGYLYNNGVYDGYTSSASYGGANFSDFTYEARLKMEAPDSLYSSNVYGLVLRGTPSFDAWNDWSNGYYFGVTQLYTYDDYYGYLELACYNVIKITNGNWTRLSPNGYWWCYDSINYADYNNFKVYMKGSTLKFYINGELMLSKSVSGPTSGRLGSFSWTGDDYTQATYLDWAVAGMPVLPASAAEVQTSSAVRYITPEEMEKLGFEK